MFNREKAHQFIAISLVSFTWFLFISSTHNYRNVSWYEWLWFSRLFTGTVGVILISLLLFFPRRNFLNLTTQYLVFSLAMQTSHGALEGPRDAEFFSFTGVFFMAACLAYKGSFFSWLKTYFPLQVGIMSVALFFKAPDYVWPLHNFIDHFSLPVVGVLLGIVIANLTTSKYTALQENLRLKELLLNEERKLVQVASQVAHDIRSPLTVLKLITGELPGVPENQQLLIHSAVSRMSDIADDLLNQRRDKALRPVLLKEAVESVLSEKRQQFRSRSEINLISELDELSSVFVSVQAGELARIFSNILNNAFEAISGPGTIRVAAKKKSSTVHLEVQDSGAGLASAQLETAAAGGLSIGKLEGSGLGLSHCQTTIRSWGGDLCFFSQIGKGTRVTMVFPSL